MLPYAYRFRLGGLSQSTSTKLQWAGINQTGTILIRGARQLITLRGPSGPRCGAALGELGLIHDGSLLIRDGEVVEVGPTRRV